MTTWQQRSAVLAAEYVKAGEAFGYKSRQCRAAHAAYTANKEGNVTWTTPPSTLPGWLERGNQGLHDGKRSAGWPVENPIENGRKTCPDCGVRQLASLTGESDFCKNKMRCDGLSRICKSCSRKQKADHKARRALALAV